MHAYWPFFYVETNAISTETRHDLRGGTFSQGYSLEGNITAASIIYVRRGVILISKERHPPSAAVRNILENFYAQIQAADSLVAFFPGMNAPFAPLAKITKIFLGIFIISFSSAWHS